MKKSRVRLNIKHLVWIFLGGGSIFFFIRAMYFAFTGGDCFSTKNPIFSWFLLILEISLSGIVGSAGIIGIIQWKRNKIPIRVAEESFLLKIVLYVGFSSYIVHFIRVAIWLILCVI